MEEKETSFMEKLLEETYRGRISWFTDYYKTSSYIQERKASHPGGENYQVDIFFTEQFQGHIMINYKTVSYKIFIVSSYYRILHSNKMNHC